MVGQNNADNIKQEIEKRGVAKILKPSVPNILENFKFSDWNSTNPEPKKRALDAITNSATEQGKINATYYLFNRLVDPNDPTAMIASHTNNYIDELSILLPNKEESEHFKKQAQEWQEYHLSALTAAKTKVPLDNQPTPPKPVPLAAWNKVQAQGIQSALSSTNTTKQNVPRTNKIETPNATQAASVNTPSSAPTAILQPSGAMSATEADKLLADIETTLTRISQEVVMPYGRRSNISILEKLAKADAIDIPEIYDLTSYAVGVQDNTINKAHQKYVTAHKDLTILLSKARNMTLPLTTKQIVDNYTQQQQIFADFEKLVKQTGLDLIKDNNLSNDTKILTLALPNDTKTLILKLSDALNTAEKDLVALKKTLAESEKTQNTPTTPPLPQTAPNSAPVAQPHAAGATTPIPSSQTSQTKPVKADASPQVVQNSVTPTLSNQPSLTPTTASTTTTRSTPIPPAPPLPQTEKFTNPPQPHSFRDLSATEFPSETQETSERLGDTLRWLKDRGAAREKNNPSSRNAENTPQTDNRSSQAWQAANPASVGAPSPDSNVGTTPPSPPPLPQLQTPPPPPPLPSAANQVYTGTTQPSLKNAASTPPQPQSQTPVANANNAEVNKILLNMKKNNDAMNALFDEKVKEAYAGNNDNSSAPLATILNKIVDKDYKLGQGEKYGLENIAKRLENISNEQQKNLTALYAITPLTDQQNQLISFYDSNLQTQTQLHKLYTQLAKGALNQEQKTQLSDALVDTKEDQRNIDIIEHQDGLSTSTTPTTPTAQQKNNPTSNSEKHNNKPFDALVLPAPTMQPSQTPTPSPSIAPTQAAQDVLRNVKQELDKNHTSHLQVDKKTKIQTTANLIQQHSPKAPADRCFERATDFHNTFDQQIEAIHRINNVPPSKRRETEELKNEEKAKLSSNIHNIAKSAQSAPPPFPMTEDHTTAKNNKEPSVAYDDNGNIEVHNAKESNFTGHIFVPRVDKDDNLIGHDLIEYKDGQVHAAGCLLGKEGVSKMGPALDANVTKAIKIHEEQLERQATQRSNGHSGV